MAHNHLEQLVAEWYEFQGYLVRRNVHVGPRPEGGYECELDIVAFHPETKRLVHIEPSLDADSWENREKRYNKKFAAGRKHIPKLFKGFDVPPDIDQIAVFTFAGKTKSRTVGGGRVQHVSELLREIVQDVSKRRLAKEMIPEQFPLLRTIQYVAEYQKALFP